MLRLVFALLFTFALSAEKVFYLMGTYAVIDLPDERKVYETYFYLRNLEDKLSTFMENSEVSLINKNAGVRAVEVSEETLRVIEASLIAKEKTYGYFDVTLGRGEVKVEGTRVFASASIDLGGIGKGYAIERAYEFAGTSQGFISIGGDMKVWGHKRVLAIRDPLREGPLLQMINAKDLCLSTSGNYFKEHIKQEDPELVQITVVFTDCTFADAFATALFAMPRDLRRKFYRENPNVGVLEVFEDGSLYINSAFFEYFEVVKFKKKSGLKK